MNSSLQCYLERAVTYWCLLYVSRFVPNILRIQPIWPLQQYWCTEVFYYYQSQRASLGKDKEHCSNLTVCLRAIRIVRKNLKSPPWETRHFLIIWGICHIHCHNIQYLLCIYYWQKLLLDSRKTNIYEIYFFFLSFLLWVLQFYWETIYKQKRWRITLVNAQELMWSVRV